MTNKEVQDTLNQASEKVWFKNVEEDFTFDHLSEQHTKKGYFDIYQYVKRQSNEWGKLDFRLPSELEKSKNNFYLLKESLESFLLNGKKESENNLKNSWYSIRTQINNLNRNRIFPIDNPITKFLIDINKKGKSTYEGAYNYFFNSSSLNFKNRNQFIGAIMAYEFQYEDSTKILKRRNAEKSSNSRIRNDFEALFTETSQDVNNFLLETKEKSREHTKTVLKLIENKKNEYEKWIAQCKQSDEVHSKLQLNRAKELEELYQKKLKLEAPAQYWKKRSIKLRSEGNMWLIWFVVFINIGILALITVLFFISNGTLKELFESSGSAIRWSIIFITFVSFLAYGIRTFAKLMFSAYHLHRDSEEREQLSYFYLALEKEQGIDDAERHLIMQSLFSRADSGLLKDESSPTMPGGGLIEKFISGK